MSPLTEPTKLTLAKTYVGIDDPDAASYIALVEAADTAAGSPGGLETATKVAIHSFVKGCKADGIWPAIKASCILAGARTLSGALVPLAGTAPTNNGPFVAGDYNRKTGLKGGGNGSSKNLLTNYTMLASSASNSHAVIFPTESISLNSELFGGYASAVSTGLNGVYVDSTSASNYYASWTSTNYLGPLARTGALVGVSRSSGASFVARGNGTSQVITQSIVSLPSNHILRIFTRNVNGVAQSYATGARIAFYSIGESLDLAKLDARVTDLINAFGAAIP